MKLAFTPTDPATIGVEWELALVDVATGQLTPAAPSLLDRVEDPDKGPIRREYLTCMVELVSGVHRRVADAMGDLGASLARLRVLLGEDVMPLGVGAHPFSIAAAQSRSSFSQSISAPTCGTNSGSGRGCRATGGTGWQRAA